MQIWPQKGLRSAPRRGLVNPRERAHCKVCKFRPVVLCCKALRSAAIRSGGIQLLCCYALEIWMLLCCNALVLLSCYLLLLLITYQFLLITSYLLLITYYSLRITYYLILITYYYLLLINHYLSLQPRTRRRRGRRRTECAKKIRTPRMMWGTKIQIATKLEFPRLPFECQPVDLETDGKVSW